MWRHEKKMRTPSLNICLASATNEVSHISKNADENDAILEKLKNFIDMYIKGMHNEDNNAGVSLN